MKIKRFISMFYDFAPRHLAESWDSIGLQIGNPESEIKKVMFALQLDSDVLEEALEKGCNLIFIHHPFIFQPLKEIDTSKEKGQIIEKLLKNDVSVFAAHTNLDAASHGLNHNLALQFDFDRIDTFGNGYKDRYKRVIIYYPENEQKEDFVEKVLESARTMLGQYSKCGFYAPGMGCFEPGESASPAVGQRSRFNMEKEIALEFLVEEKFLGNVLQTAVQLHPYEEPVIITQDTVHPVKQMYTLGRIGYFSSGMEFTELLKEVRKIFRQESIRYSRNHTRPVKKVGVVGGSGMSMMTRAASSGCDLFITGDLKHHDWDLAKEIGLSVIEVSHFVMEELAFKIFFDEYKNLLLKYTVDAEYSLKCRENFNYF